MYLLFGAHRFSERKVSVAASFMFCSLLYLCLLFVLDSELAKSRWQHLLFTCTWGSNYFYFLCEGRRTRRQGAGRYADKGNRQTSITYDERYCFFSIITERIKYRNHNEIISGAFEASPTRPAPWLIRPTITRSPMPLYQVFLGILCD